MTTPINLSDLNAELEDRHDAMVRKLAKNPADILLSPKKGSEIILSEWTAWRDEKIDGLTFDKQRVNMMHACIGLGGEPGEFAALLTLKDGSDKLVEGLIEETGDLYFYSRLLRQELGSTFVPISLSEVLKIVSSYHPEIDSFEFTRDINLVTGYVLLNLGVGITIDAMKRVFIYNGELDSCFKDRPVTFRQAGIDGLQVVEFALGLMLGYVEKTRDDSLQANWFKLEGSKDARYKDGYTDAAAHDRADKVKQTDDDLDGETLGDACAIGDETCEACQ